MNAKKLSCFLIICTLACGCSRDIPAPVRWGGRSQNRSSYFSKKPATTPTYTYKKPSTAKIIKHKSIGSVVVKRGDTAYSLARENDIPLRTFLEINNLKAPYKLTIGNKLKLPQSEYYVVKKGDTLYSISRDKSISISALTSLNTINPPYSISVGQKLTLPNKKKSIAAKQTGNQKKITTKIPKRNSSKFFKPVKGKVISTFGSKKNGLHNDGINIAAKKGTPVKAAENGIVVYSSNKIKGLGNIILIKHDGGWISTYAHLDKSLVKKSVKVDKGSTIGTVGETGSVDSPQLHFEIRKNTKPVNPQKYM